MTISNLPPFYDMTYTNKDGRLMPEAYLYNDQLWQSLNLAVTLLNTVVTSAITNNNQIVNNGVVFPSLTTAQITALLADAPIGSVWFNTDVAKLQVKTAAGIVQTITSA